jgi:hypothetical protein
MMLAMHVAGYDPVPGYYVTVRYCVHNGIDSPSKEVNSLPGQCRYGVRS